MGVLCAVLGGTRRANVPRESRGGLHSGGVLSLPNPSLLQAHEDSEKLREIVLPMEQEIEELKTKLLRAEELIQEIQVREQPGTTQGERGAARPWPPSLFPAPLP